MYFAASVPASAIFLDVSKNRGVFPPKWMVNIMVPNPIKMDDLGGPPLFLETPISKVTAKNPKKKTQKPIKTKDPVELQS